MLHFPCAETSRCAGLRLVALAGVLAFSQVAFGWTAPQVLDTGGLRFESTLQLATNAAGTWEAVWCSNSPLGLNYGVVHSRSTNSGATWSTPAVLNTNTSATASFENRAVIAAGSASTWVVAWDSEDTGAGIAGGDKDILFSRSTDNGANWGATAVLNSDAGANHYRNYAPAVASDGAGVWVCAWEAYDSTSGTLGFDNDLRFARSTDNGATWSSVANLNTDAAVDARIDTSVRLASDRSGHWIAVWEGHLNLVNPAGQDPEIFYAVSGDNGVTWGTPKPLNVNAFTDSGSDFCPQIACDGAGNWVAVWASNDSLGGTIGPDDDILFAKSVDNGTTWSMPAAVAQNAASDTRTDADPGIAYGAGCFSVVWSSLDTSGACGKDPDILYSCSSNGGSDWSAPVFANTNALSDTVRDQAPQTLTDSSGKQLVAWTTGTYPNGDMLYSTAVLSAAATDWTLY